MSATASVKCEFEWGNLDVIHIVVTSSRKLWSGAGRPSAYRHHGHIWAYDVSLINPFLGTDALSRSGLELVKYVCRPFVTQSITKRVKI